MKLLRIITQVIVGAAITASSTASASQIVRAWYHGTWDCTLDGRPAKMVWTYEDASPPQCSDGICSTTSAIRTVGWFSDNGGPWVRLGINAVVGDRLNIRYMGEQPDNWYLDYNREYNVARGQTTWQGMQFPLSCGNHQI